MTNHEYSTTEKKVPTTLPDELKLLIKSFNTTYEKLNPELTTINISDDAWSLNEIIGHLIDSASNNHQRFIRLQLEEKPDLLDYSRDQWLNIQNYNRMNFHDLRLLFVYYNKLIINIIASVNSESLNHSWDIQWNENKKSITLLELIIHYVNHIKEHIVHFEKRLSEIQNKHIVN